MLEDTKKRRRIAAVFPEAIRSLVEAGTDSERLQQEVVKLREAIRDAGFAVMQTSGKWSIHDVSEKAKAQAAFDDKRTTELIMENIRLEKELSETRACVTRLERWLDDLNPKLSDVSRDT